MKGRPPRGWVQRRLVWVVVASALVAVSGCLSHAASKPRAEVLPSAEPAVATARTGAIAGLMEDEEAQPIAGAQVALAGLARVTQSDASGAFTFNGLPPGLYRVAASRAGFASLIVPVRVEAGQVVPLKLQLMNTPGTGDAVVRTEVFEGYVPCSYNVYYPTHACAGLFSTPERSHVPFVIDESLDFKALLLELSWTPRTRLSGQELELDLCLPQSHSSPLHCAEDHLNQRFYKFASGPSPVKLNLEAIDLPLDEYTDYEAWVGAGYLSPWPVLDQPFTLYLTICYFLECPAGFSALGSSPDS